MNLNIDPKLQAEVEKIFAGLGLSREQAIQLFYEHVKEKKALPFPYNIPNQETQLAMQETLAETNGTRYKNFEDFKKSIEKDLKDC